MPETHLAKKRQWLPEIGYPRHPIGISLLMMKTGLLKSGLQPDFIERRLTSSRVGRAGFEFSNVQAGICCKKLPQDERVSLTNP